MISKGFYPILRNKLLCCDYDFILSEIDKNMVNQETLLISPIASQTLVLAYFNRSLRDTLNRFTYLVSCSEWIKRSMNFIYKLGIKRRVYGPLLMEKICTLAKRKNYKIYLYGNTLKTLEKLQAVLERKYPKIKIVGFKPSKFSSLTSKEKKEIVADIKESGADIVFVGLGSPLQEEVAVDLFHSASIKRALTVITVGAAFDFIARTKPQAPAWMQERGLEWLFRLTQEPKRLWRRYLVLGPIFLWLIFLQKLGMLNISNDISIERKSRK